MASDVLQSPPLLPMHPSDGSIGKSTIDVIAVHGLETNSPRTWIAHERDEEPKGKKINWLCDEDMLPRVVPQARVWAYNYNANYRDNAQEVNIMGLGESFLGTLDAKAEELGRRPLVFVGSCFGGIVVAQALEIASRDQVKYETFLNSIAGVVFLGTPLKGTRVASLAEWVAFLYDICGKESSSTLLEALGEKGSYLDSATQGFAKLALTRQFPVHCFYETRETKIAKAVFKKSPLASLFRSVKLVERESACLDGHSHCPLAVSHGMMNKFRGPQDGNFVLVSNCLKNMVERACTLRGRTEKEIECLQCLTSNYREDKDRNAERVKGTCEWALQHPKFLNWRKDTSALLWISADPGCGKSVLSKALVDERLVIEEASTASVCYFFFKDDDAERQNGAQALSALLHQLFVQNPALLERAMNDFRKHGKSFRTMMSTLWDILIQAAGDPKSGKIVCVLDALDECNESRSSLIQKLGELYATKGNTNLKFLVTSRPYFDIESTFRRNNTYISSIKLSGEDESEQISKEINLVIDTKIPEIFNHREYPPERRIQDSLIEKLKATPNRTYLWLRLMFDIMEKTLESTGFRLVGLVDKLPRTIDEAYEKILSRIQEDQVEDARRLLHIIVTAIRPLTVREMNVALALDESFREGKDCRSWSDLDLPSERNCQDKIRQICGLFISIVDSRIYLIHQTAKEFLIAKEISEANTQRFDNVWRQSLSPSESNSILARLCISYLQFDEHSRTMDNQQLLGDSPEYDFLDYAASFWADHFWIIQGKADISVLPTDVIDVCNTQSNGFQKWFQIYWAVKPLSMEYGYHECSKRITSLMVASYLGLYTIVKVMFEQRGYKANAPVAKLQLKQKAQKSIEINARDGYGWTSLHYAVPHGHIEIVKLLLEQEGIEVNAQDDMGWTPLHRAAWEGHIEVVKLLVEQEGIEVNARDNGWGGTPLHQAAGQGHIEVVKLLVEQEGIEVNARDNSGGTPLHQAAGEGHIEVVKLLVEQEGIEVNARDNGWGGTPLHRAAWEGHIEVVKLLVEQEGIEVNARDNEWGGTPYSLSFYIRPYGRGISSKRGSRSTLEIIRAGRPYIGPHGRGISR